MQPCWSVLIPAYRCNEFLPECMHSVLAQDLGSDRLQIAVVNDDPTDAECAAVVQHVSAGRVEYHRNEKNLGAGGNFNRCLALAAHELVLLLHGDCYVKPQFFERMSALARAHPDVGLLACRAEGVDGHGNLHWESLRYPAFESPTRDDSPIWESLHLMPSAIVVRRQVYQQLGGFREDIANGQDWEMWSRIIRAAGIVMIPDVLAGYRQHADSITGRTRRSAQNIRELGHLYQLFAAEISGYPLDRMRAGLRGMAYSQAREFERRGDREAARANFAAWRGLTSLPAQAIAHVKRFGKTLLGRTT